jgi:flavin-dependent dehydrogenase
MKGMERARFFYSGIQAEIPWSTEEDLVEVHPHASTDFFGWVIPLGRGRARVGLAGGEDVPQRFRTFLQGRSDRCIDLVTGTIPFGPMPRTYGERVLYVGDAAGLVKPTSGGGVYTGVRSAHHAATVAIACCESGDFSDRHLARYERLWKADFGRELALGFRLLAARRTMSREQVDRILRTLNTPGIRDLSVAHGDMDRPGRLVQALLQRADLLGTAAALLWSFARSGMK